MRKALRRMRSTSYGIGRLLGDVIAILSGPKAIGKRLVNKAVGRGIISKLFWR